MATWTGWQWNDPEVVFFGSQMEFRRICADNATLSIHFEYKRIIE